MLKHLRLVGVGPAAEMRMDLAPRLNLITGDNGLGKSFLLDVAWWALTRTWARLPARPTKGAAKAQISFSFDGAKGEESSGYDRRQEEWREQNAGSPPDGLVLYAQVDGGFSIWDPARNYWRIGGDGNRPSAYLFSSQEVWDGLNRDGRPICKGLIEDWASWQGHDDSSVHKAFSLLKRALAQLSPSEDEALLPGPLTRISLNDVRDIPTLHLHGSDVPIVQASAGIRRIVALCYLLVWSFIEHQRACELLEQPTAKKIIFLIDEVDNHLHPRWQRRVLSALLEVVKGLFDDDAIEVQLLAATHSPLVLASVESVFDESRDQLWHLGTEHGRVELSAMPWAKQGDVLNWLVSPVFGLHQARSIEAERAIEAAEAFMRNDSQQLPEGLQTVDQIHQELLRLLPGADVFWPRWLVTAGLVAGSGPKP